MLVAAASQRDLKMRVLLTDGVEVTGGMGWELMLTRKVTGPKSVFVREKSRDGGTESALRAIRVTRCGGKMATLERERQRTSVDFALGRSNLLAETQDISILQLHNERATNAHQ